MSGGDDAKRGLIDKALGSATKEVGGNVSLSNPAAMEHIFESYLGGMYKAARQIVQMSESAIKQEMPEARSLPIANRFYTTSSINGLMMKVNEKYYDYLDEMKETFHDEKAYGDKLAERDLTAVDSAKYISKKNQLINSKKYEIAKSVSRYSKRIKKRSDKLKTIIDKKSKEDLQNGINKLKIEMVEVLD